MKAKSIFFKEDYINYITSDRNLDIERANMTFMAIDLKVLPDGSIRILEKGDGMKALYNGYSLANPGLSIMEQFWNYVTYDRGLQIHYLESERFAGRQDIFEIIASQYDLNSLFDNYHGLHGNMTALKNITDFEMYGKKNKWFEPGNIFTYSGMIISDHCSELSRDEHSMISKQFPSLLHLNDTPDFKHVLEDKVLTNILYTDELEHSKPDWQVVNKHYSEERVQKILDQIKSDYLVVKPINGCKGNGVVIIKRDELDLILRAINKVSNNSEITKNIAGSGERKARFNFKDAYDYWSYDQNKFLLVEEYVPSKEIFHNGKFYDPTMRVALTLESFNDSLDNSAAIKMHVLGSYWKLPISPMGDRVTNSCSVSTIAQGRDCAAPVSENDNENVFEQLKIIMPEVYKKMLTNNVDSILRYLTNSEENLEYCRYKLKGLGYPISE